MDISESESERLIYKLNEERERLDKIFPRANRIRRTIIPIREESIPGSTEVWVRYPEEYLLGYGIEEFEDGMSSGQSMSRELDYLDYILPDMYRDIEDKDEDEEYQNTHNHSWYKPEDEFDDNTPF